MAEARALGLPLAQSPAPSKTNQAQTDREETYAERCKHWLEESEAEYRSALAETGKRQKRPPLILTGHGLSLSVKGGALFVRDGLTHHPQERAEHLIFPGRHNVPSRIVVLGESGSVTLDAMRWLSEQGVPLTVLDYRGEQVTSMTSCLSEPDHETRVAQILCLRPDRALTIAKSLVSQKLTATLGNFDLFANTERKQEAETVVRSCLSALDAVSTTTALFAIEATAAQVYFGLWQELPLRWTPASMRVIPESWRTFGSRSSEITDGNRHASHPVNAMLNYGYALLESQVRIAIAASGFDSCISYLHSVRRGRKSLVYDLMEPTRIAVDRRIVLLASQSTLSAKDFITTAEGKCRLNPSLARRLSIATELTPQIGVTCDSVMKQMLAQS